jgi:hypothetical protein
MDDIWPDVCRGKQLSGLGCFLNAFFGQINVEPTGKSIF